MWVPHFKKNSPGKGDQEPSLFFFMFYQFRLFRQGIVISEKVSINVQSINETKKRVHYADQAPVILNAEQGQD